jgi:hypothetical protein
MPRFQFERESRTPYSEVFSVYDGDAAAGRVDLHYSPDVVHATLCVPDTFSEDDVQELIGEVDDRLVMSVEPFRDDFVVTVWLGRLAGVYSEDFDEDAEEDVEGNGHLD